MVSAPARRQQAKLALARGLSSRSACALMNVSRSMLYYRARQPAKDAPVLAAMRDLSAQYPRFGYRRIGVYLERAGHVMSWDRTHRLWKLAGLQVPRKRPRKRIASQRPRPLPATGPNQVWAYDFVFDACANNQQLKCLTVIDEWTRESLEIDVQGSIRSRPGDRGAQPPDQRARRAAPSALGQRSRVRQPARCSSGCTRPASIPRSAIRASRGRMGPTKASTASSATSA
jgi:transposase InsO family protein